MPLVAVLDADVLFPMYLRDTLLRLSAAGCFRLHWTNEILDEVTRNLIKNEKMDEVAAATLALKMTGSFEEALVEGWEDHVGTALNHPKDRHVVAAALAIEASIIVTGNVKHFKPLPEGMVAMTSGQFLLCLLDTFPEEVVETIELQAAAYANPPLTPSELLARLARSAPRFAAAASIHHDGK